MAVKILQPKKPDLLWKRGQLSPIRFKYNEKIYETYEPYFFIKKLTKLLRNRLKSYKIKEFLEDEVSDLNSSINNDEQKVFSG
jgi:hypothetical protein